MADFGTSVVEKLIEVIGSELIKEVCHMWGYKSDLEDLKQTVCTIRNVLQDAEAKRELSCEMQDYVAKLKDAVYDADDLFDEFHTLAELKQHAGPLSKRGKVYEKVRCFFSSKNQLSQAYRMSRDVKDIKNKLGAIADSHQKFGFSVDYKPISRRREETCSYVDAKDIIGRDKDKEAIVGMLLDHTQESGFVTIVGVGGLGKTALAQLVYNDQRIKDEFPDSRLWVCVSDQDGVSFDVKTILCKILEVVAHEKFDGSYTMELVQYQIQDKLRGRKYLLVLDDVWNEDREKWLNLKKFLTMGQGGSKVVVTTRSERTGTIICEKHVYNLQGLSREHSWGLFQMSAFEKGDSLEDHDELVKIGKKIVEKCHDNPLALKVVGSLLFGQHVDMWRNFEVKGLASTGKSGNEILSILKLSYHNLLPSLKNCFSYCAVFPKDFFILKQELIGQWIAQGYIIPDGQSIEDTAEGYFLILLRRCFFQDVSKDDFNNIQAVKIHDLMHDVAQEVGGDEICALDSMANGVGDKIRHVQYVGDNCVIMPSESRKIRSFIFRGDVNDNTRVEKCVVGSQIDKWKCLRVLEMAKVGVKKLPKSIGKLLHVRYLDLSGNGDLEVLPDEITRLHNLQTLLLTSCWSLRELPEDFCKLVKLRHLGLEYCNRLTSMPCGMERLTSLRLLPYYVVGATNKRSVTGAHNGLKALKAFTGIIGSMEIRVGEIDKEGMSNSGREGFGGDYLKGMKHLTSVVIDFKCNQELQEGVVENLQPASNVKELFILGYVGTRIPKWGRAVDNWAVSLSLLVNITLFECFNMCEMPVVSKLPRLKSLFLHELHKLEYMEMEIGSSESDTKSDGLDALFFPSLEELEMSGMKMLKGWWKEDSPGVGDADHSCRSYRSLTFSRLSRLMIYDCPKLTLFPLCPTLQSLELRKTHERLQVTTIDNRAGNLQQDVKLTRLIIDDMGLLKSLPINCLTDLQISGNHKFNGLLQVSDVFASSLKTLGIEKMNTLKTLCGATGLQRFTSLAHLSLGCIGFFIQTGPQTWLGGGGGEEEEENEFETCDFAPNLRYLEFIELRKMKSLPAGMQCLTSLQTLEIERCTTLEGLPEWISCLSSLKYLKLDECPALNSLPQAMTKLTSLQHLRIIDCPKLAERCKEPNGEDRPKIQHVPDIHIVTY